MIEGLLRDWPSGAVFSPCRTWRYALHRTWDESKESCLFIGLNPSTADETKDDPTIRRCIGFARAWGYGSLTMANVYAYRATDPRELETCSSDPVGPDNDEALAFMGERAAIIVAAWGTKAGSKRVKQVVRVLGGLDLHCLKLTKHGHPEHPLYMPAATRPQVWRPS